jgi:hypothetical protein
MFAQDIFPPRFEGWDALINTENDVSIFLKSLDKSEVNFGRIFSLVRNEFDDSSLPDFRIRRTINWFSHLGSENAFLREIPGRSGESGNGI